MYGSFFSPFFSFLTLLALKLSVMTVSYGSMHNEGIRNVTVRCNFCWSSTEERDWRLTTVSLCPSLPPSYSPSLTRQCVWVCVSTAKTKDDAVCLRLGWISLHHILNTAQDFVKGIYLSLFHILYVCVCVVEEDMIQAECSWWNCS